jgi:hypothetical protein
LSSASAQYRPAHDARIDNIFKFFSRIDARCIVFNIKEIRMTSILLQIAR